MVDVGDCAKAGCLITIDATAGETRARTRTIRKIGFMRVIIKATFLSVQRDPHNKHQHGEQTCLGIAGVFGIVAYLAESRPFSEVASDSSRLRTHSSRFS